eukprot:TRINITY_DN21614_c0_g1_i1.p1 TRINITY_DN21614_c0_g1~~TRINITY_DN21614_c0_g1_i1.p1  ORF type:complete len:276 (+),score=33.08 TRINITY_DN21614_c0_g1_i1:119-946(+)
MTVSAELGCECLSDGRRPDASGEPGCAWMVSGSGEGHWVQLQLEDNRLITGLEIIHVNRPLLERSLGQMLSHPGEICSQPELNLTACVAGLRRLKITASSVTDGQASFDHEEVIELWPQEARLQRTLDIDQDSSPHWEPYQRHTFSTPISTSLITIEVLEAFDTGGPQDANGMHELRLLVPDKEEATPTTAQKETLQRHQAGISEAQAAFWAGMTDAANYPHLQHFDSLPALLLGFLELDAWEVSAAMRLFHKQVVLKNQAFYRSRLGPFFPGGH